MRRAWLSLGFILLFLALGCQRIEPEPGHSAEFKQVEMPEAPEALRAYGVQTRAVPGLAVVHEGAYTYLLLCAGGAEGAGYRLEVLEVRMPVRTGQEARLLATARSDQTVKEYPCTVVRLQASPDLQYKLRLNTRTGKVVELDGVPVQQ